MCLFFSYLGETEDICIVERLFSSSLVAIVSLSAPRKLKVCHFKVKIKFQIIMSVSTLYLSNMQSFVSIHKGVPLLRFRLATRELKHSMMVLSCGWYLIFIFGALSLPAMSWNSKLSFYIIDKLDSFEMFIIHAENIILTSGYHHDSKTSFSDYMIKYLVG